jgi:hypothetical protein
MQECLGRPRLGGLFFCRDDRAMAERCGVTRPRIVDELAKIAFSDICKVVTWRSELTTVTKEGEGEVGEGPKEVLMFCRTFVHPPHRTAL